MKKTLLTIVATFFCVLNVSAQDKAELPYEVSPETHQKVTSIKKTAVIERIPQTVLDSAFAVLKDSVLTFYYGGTKPDGSFSINTYKPLYSIDIDENLGCIENFDLNARAPQWNNRAAEIKKVVFDESFRNFRPTSCYEWFSGCYNLTEFVGMKENLNTEETVYMTAMFMGCIRLKTIDLSGFNTRKVRNMHSMFSLCMQIENLDLGGFITDSLHTTAMMFDGCENLKDLNINSFNTPKVQNMGGMFSGCKNLETIDFSSFNTSNCHNMSFMFAGSGIREIDVSSFDMHNIGNGSQYFHSLNGMFMDCKNLERLDVSTFKGASYYSGMFFGCSSLKELILYTPPVETENGFTLSFIGNTTALFYGCSSLEKLDLSMWQKVFKPNMPYMFANCTNLKTIYVDKNWSFEYAEPFEGCYWAYSPLDTTDIFKNCYNLIGGNGTKYSHENKSNFLFARIDDDVLPGYFTSKNSVAEKKTKSKVLLPAKIHIATYYDENKQDVVDTNLWGFVNQVGEWAIKPRYSYVFKFDKNGVAKVYLDGKYSFINQKGNPVPKPQPKNVPSNFSDVYEPFVSDMKIVQKFGKYGYAKNYDTLIAPQFDYAYDFDQYGFAAITIDGKIGYIDTTGKIVFEPNIEKIGDYENLGLVPVLIDGKWGFVDSTKTLTIPPQFEKINGGFSDNGLASVKIVGKWGYIDTKGNWAIEPQFDKAGKFYYKMTEVEIDGKHGYITPNGKYFGLYTDKFDIYQHDFNQLPFARINKYVNRDYRYGLINKHGKILVEPKFSHIMFFKDVILAEQGNYWGIINKHGNFKKQPTFQKDYQIDWY